MYISSKRFKKKMTEIERNNKSYERKMILENTKKYGKLKMPPTSKIVLLAVFVMCIEIIIFCECMMCRTGDMSAMYALIGVPTTLVPIVISYYSKSTKENTKGGIVYESAMAEYDECPQG